MATEDRGFELATDTVRRIRDSGLKLPYDTQPPEGPYFNYGEGASLFCGRRGSGPLNIAWDTNLLLDYFEYGELLWEGESLPSVVSAEHGEELEALQLIVSLWVVRDIRFHILSGVLSDSKSKPLSEQRARQRINAWEEFCSAIALMGDGEDRAGVEVTRSTPTRSDADVEFMDALSRVPAGNDRSLVAEALMSGMHVFLTRDKGVLGAASSFAPLGLLLASPQELLEHLGAAGALHCLFKPQYLYWPAPDQQRVTHLIRALEK